MNYTLDFGKSQPLFKGKTKNFAEKSNLFRKKANTAMPGI